MLFIGNSFTYFNDMPAMLGKLVAAGPTPERERSWRLSQEESAWRAGTELARTLNAEIRALGSRTAIYETWGLQASLIPVGRAFAAALIARPQTPS